MTLEAIKIKAVIPVAGYGLRWLPLTKAIPKEFLPIGKRPVIDYVVNEAISAGIKEIIFVVSPERAEIKKYFRPNKKLEKVVSGTNDEKLIAALSKTSFPVKFTYVVQESPKGLGQAVLAARGAVGDGIFAVILPDEFLLDGAKQMRNMIKTAVTYGVPTVAVKRLPGSRALHYGVVTTKAFKGSAGASVRSAVEKPRLFKGKFCYALIGRYVFNNDIFDMLLKENADLTSSINALAKAGEVRALLYPGRRYDIGSYEGFLRANIEVGDKTCK